MRERFAFLQSTLEDDAVAAWRWVEQEGRALPAMAGEMP